LSEINNQVKCLHCEGTGLCHQSIKAISRKEAKYHEDTVREDGDWHTVSVLDYTLAWQKAICKICGKTPEVLAEGPAFDEAIYQEPEQLICQVCGGSGYIGITPYFLQIKDENHIGFNSVISKELPGEN
jgi:hypothetical protein